MNYFNADNPEIQVVSAAEGNAYIGVKMNRTTAMITNKAFEYPLVLDIYSVKSDSVHQLDFPFYYKGQLVSTDFKYQKSTKELKALGTKNGYQHLWLEATGKTDKPIADFTFVQGNRFYSITTLANPATQFKMTRIGAGDPDFNLRNTTCFMIHQPNATTHTFVSVIEPHGLYDLTREVTENYDSNLSNLVLLRDDEAFSAVIISLKNGQKFLFITANKDFDESKIKTLVIKDKTISFKANYYFSEIQN